TLDLTNAMTMEAWVRPSSVSNFTSVLMKERSGGLSYALYASDGANSPPAAYISSGSDRSGRATSVLPLNTWSHLAATYDGSNINFYVNGVLAGSASASGNITTSTGALRFGGNSIWGEYFSGLIDEIRVYNRVLSLPEIQSDMSTPIGGTLDATAPTGSLSTPASGATVSGAVNVTASAADDVAVGGVQFLLGGQPLGTEDKVAPDSVSWDSLKVVNGSHTLSARIRDLAGNTTTTSGTTVTVNNAADTVAPTIRLSVLNGGRPVGGGVVVQADADDNIGVAGVQFKVNGSNIGA